MAARCRQLSTVVNSSSSETRRAGRDHKADGDEKIGADIVRRALEAPVRQIAANARLLVLASEPAEGGNPKSVATARATEGFVRSIGKEIGKSYGLCYCPDIMSYMLPLLLMTTCPRKGDVTSEIVGRLTCDAALVKGTFILEQHVVSAIVQARAP